MVIMFNKLPFRTLGLAVVVGVIFVSVELRDTVDRILAIVAVLLLFVVGFLETRQRRANIEHHNNRFRSIKKGVEIERGPRRGAP